MSQLPPRPANSTRLHNLHLDLMPLVVVATHQTWSHHEISVTLSTPDSERKDTTIQLGLLRHRVLAALQTYMAQKQGVTGGNCPGISIDGRGQVKDIVDTGKVSSVQYNNTSLGGDHSIPYADDGNPTSDAHSIKIRAIESYGLRYQSSSGSSSSGRKSIPRPGV
jgi:hypothetical protein